MIAPASPGLEFSWNAATKHLRQVDPRYAPIIDAFPDPMVPRASRSPFEALMRAVIYQQLSGKAAATIHGRVLDRCPRRRPTAKIIEGIDDTSLREAGVSHGKIRAIRDLSQHSLDGRLPGYAALRRKSDEEVIETLTQIHGIGRWTAEMLLMFTLGRPDVLPVGDLGVRNGFAKIRGRGGSVTPEQLERAAKKWRPYRSVASWYCYRALEMPKGG